MIKVRVHRFDSLTVGGQRLAGAQIGVGDSQLRAPDMMLGLDYLRSRRVWVSYRTSRIFVQ